MSMLRCSLTVLKDDAKRPYQKAMILQDTIILVFQPLKTIRVMFFHIGLIRDFNYWFSAYKKSTVFKVM